MIMSLVVGIYTDNKKSASEAGTEIEQCEGKLKRSREVGRMEGRGQEGGKREREGNDTKEEFRERRVKRRGGRRRQEKG